MTEEEYKAAVIKVGQAFKELPDDRARLDVLVGLTSVMTKKAELTGQDELLKDWLETAYGNLQGAHMIWKDR